MGGTVERLPGSLPWPNVRGKRCLALAAGLDAATELKERGAAVVDTEPADGVAYDVVLAWGVLDGAASATTVAAGLRAATRGVLLSVEPIDLRSSLVSRGRPLFTPVGGDRFGFNGAGHRHLLESAGFAVERVSKPFTVADGTAPAGRADVLLRRVLTGSDAAGRVHRALLGRPTATA